MSFALSVGQWGRETMRDFEERRRAIILELFSSVIFDTPVLSGRLRGNWLVSIGSPKTGTVQTTDKLGDKAVQRVRKGMGDGTGQDLEVFLVNNLPYAHRIEYDGWSHTKAPEGMVRKNFIRVLENLKLQ